MDRELEQFLDDAAARDAANYVVLTIRELIGKWDARRRGYWVVDRIESDLGTKGLTTEPPFTQGWIDNHVRLKPAAAEGPAEEIAEAVTSTAAATEDVIQQSLPATDTGFSKVGSLQSASTDVCRVQRESTLEHAQSLMMQHDYSQLAVMSGGRELKGAISWESIAQASIRHQEPGLRDAIVPAEVVGFEDDLLTHIPRIIESGYVFVRGNDQIIRGIVTTADLSAEFARLANPFFLVGDIERRLRRAIDARFPSEELLAMRDPTDSQRQVEGAKDLGFGEYRRLLEKPEHWARMEWRVDRVVFVAALDEIRLLRNDVMHFSPDPLEPGQVRQLYNFIRWLKLLGEP